MDTEKQKCDNATCQCEAYLNKKPVSNEEVCQIYWTVAVVFSLMLGWIFGSLASTRIERQLWTNSAFKNDAVYYKTDTVRKKAVLTWKHND